MSNRDNNADHSLAARKATIDNFLASSRLDGYEAKGALTKKQLEVIAGHNGTQEELKEKLIRAYGG